MNRRIPNGSSCVFRHPVEGSRDGKTVLVQHRDVSDPDTGGQYTVKVYRSQRSADERGGWRHVEVRLEPDSLSPDYEPVILRNVPEDEIAVIAEVVEVLPGTQE